MRVTSEYHVGRIFKIAKFLGVKYDKKKMDFADFLDLVYDKMAEWEEENGMDFPM